MWASTPTIRPRAFRKPCRGRRSRRPVSAGCPLRGEISGCPPRGLPRATRSQRRQAPAPTSSREGRLWCCRGRCPHRPVNIRQHSDRRRVDVPQGDFRWAWASTPTGDHKGCGGKQPSPSRLTATHLPQRARLSPAGKTLPCGERCRRRRQSGGGRDVMRSMTERGEVRGKGFSNSRSAVQPNKKRSPERTPFIV